MRLHMASGQVSQGLKGQEIMEVQCCVCKRIRKDDHWVRPARTEAVNAAAMSHGYCPRCASKVLEDIRAQGGLLKGLRTAS